MNDTDQSAEYCRTLVKRDDPDRYLLSLFAPSEKQRSVWALLAFNQEIAKIKDTVSEPMLGEIRVQWWQDVLEELVQGHVREQPVIQELANLVKDSQTFSLMQKLVDARKQDFDNDQGSSFESLKLYTYGVGGTLYEANMRLQLEDFSEAAVTASQDLGAAWAMLGLVRAIPHSWTTNAKPLTSDMASGMHTQDAEDAYLLLKPVISDMLTFAEEKKANAASLRAKLRKQERSLLRLASLIGLYQDVLKKHEGNPFKAGQHEVSDFKKISRLMWASITGRYQ